MNGFISNPAFFSQIKTSSQNLEALQNFRNELTNAAPLSLKIKISTGFKIESEISQKMMNMKIISKLPSIKR